MLILTPDCYRREWVAVEIFTSHLHSVHDAMTKVDGCLTPDATFLGRFPQAFDATSVCSGVHAPGMTDLTIHDAYRGLRAQVLVPFLVCDAGGRASIRDNFSRQAPQLAADTVHQDHGFGMALPDGDGQSNPSHPCPLVRPRSRGGGLAA